MSLPLPGLNNSAPTSAAPATGEGHALELQALAQSAAEGDREALADLVSALQPRVYRVCLRMLCNPDDAADAAQDTLIAVVRHITNFERRSRVTTWVTRIAINTSISQIRKQRRRPAVSLEAESPGSGDDQARALRDAVADHREPPPDHGVERSDEVQAVLAAMDTLDPDFRAVLVLRDIEGMSMSHIAESLDLPVGTAKSRLFRARLALRQALTTAEPIASPSPGRSG